MGTPADLPASLRDRKGHEFDRENTYYPKRGGRICRTCRRDNMHRYSRR